MGSVLRQRGITAGVRWSSLKRICKYCGKTYEGDPGSSACPECVQKNNRTTIRQRVCSVCGATFMAGPSSKFCPACLAERKREQAARRRRTGTLRPIGSVDKCLSCGQEYIVTGGKQKSGIKRIPPRSSERQKEKRLAPKFRALCAANCLCRQLPL